MGLGLSYAYTLTPNTTLELYAAPVGDPALGPTAYPHRASAMELPQAPLSHHWQDSTHISDDVLTAGIAWHSIKLEASGFHGAEPGENRWIVQAGAIDSWSARLWYFPYQTLGRAILRREAHETRSPRTRRPAPPHRLAPVFEIDARRNLVFQSHLGQESQHSYTPQSERVSRGIRAAHPYPELHHRPHRTR